MKHTKGNWKAINLYNNWLIVDEKTDNLVDIRDNETNAKLIAAAPELLDVLQTIENDNNQIPDWLWIRIKLAIRKATK